MMGLEREGGVFVICIQGDKGCGMYEQDRGVSGGQRTGYEASFTDLMPMVRTKAWRSTEEGLIHGAWLVAASCTC